MEIIINLLNKVQLILNDKFNFIPRYKILVVPIYLKQVISTVQKLCQFHC